MFSGNKKEDLVFQFLGGTFHQDIDSPEEALRVLLETESNEYLESAAVFLKAFINSSYTNEEKNAYIAAAADGISFPALGLEPIQWLHLVNEKLNGKLRKEQLVNFIKVHMEPDDFTGGTDENQIHIIEKTLGLKLPESYKWFLKSYGFGGIFGVDILGVDKSNIASVTAETERYRRLGMSGNLVVIEDVDEYAYCLDTGNLENNECPVIAWNRQGGLDSYYTAENFFEFFYQRLLGAKEAWEEEF